MIRFRLRVSNQAYAVNLLNGAAGAAPFLPVSIQRKNHIHENPS